MRISDWSSDVCSSDLMISTNDSPPGVWCQLGDGEYLPSVHTDCCNRDSTAPSFLCCEYCRAIYRSISDTGIVCWIHDRIGCTRRGAAIDAIIKVLRRCTLQNTDRKSTRLNSSH